MQFRSCALALVFATCALASVSHDNTQRTLLEYKQKITQPDYSEGYPNTTKYLEKRIVPAGAGGFAMAIIAILIFIIFACCRGWALCCQCCKNKFFDCCCGTGKATDDPDVGYSKCTRTALFIALLVCAVGLAVGGIVGDQGMNKVVDGAVDLFNDASKSVDQMSAVVKVIQNAGKTLGQNPDTASMNEAISDVRKTVKDKQKDVSDNTDKAKLVSKIFFAVFCVNTILGIGAWLCNKGCPATCMTLNGFFLCILAWILFAVFYMGGAFLDDTCVQLDMWYKCKMPNTPKGTDCSKLRIDAFLKCPDASSFSEGYTKSLKQASDLIQAYAVDPRFNAATKAKFTYPNATCPNGVDCVNAAAFNNWGANGAWRKKQFVAVGKTTIGKKCDPGSKKDTAYSSPCHDTCKETDLSKDPSTLSQACVEKAILTAADVLWGSSYVASCTFLTSIAGSSTADSGSCNKLGDGFVFIFAAFGLIGCLYFIVIIIGIHGSTAWDGEAHQDVETTTTEAVAMDGPLEGSAEKESTSEATAAKGAGSGAETEMQFADFASSDAPASRDAPAAERPTVVTSTQPDVEYSESQSAWDSDSKVETRGCCSAPSN
jgi:hypothetical protein